MNDQMHGVDFLIFSDGSGHVDGYGGWSVIVTTPDRSLKYCRLGAVVGTSVDRAEFTALLEGLQVVFEITKSPLWSRLQQQSKKIVKSPLVHIYSDRENLVLSIKGVYGRHSAEDLWARFEWYAKRFIIRIEHVSRENEYPEFQEADLHASTGRLVALAAGLGEYSKAQELRGHVVL